MKAGDTKNTIRKKCPNCGKSYPLDPSVALRDQNVCKDCK